MLDFDVDGPGSSPFQSHVESRTMSKQWESHTTTETRMETHMEEQTLDIFATPMKQSAGDDMMDEDKENVPEQHTTTSPQKLVFSPKKNSRPCTPEEKPIERAASPVTEKRRSSKDSDLMPPPSTRRTPKRSALNTSQSAANMPRQSALRGNSYNGLERTDTNSSGASSFQAGLDLRASHMSHAQPHHDSSNLDDTCFSAFSEIPEMTVFAKLGQSPTKRGDMQRTPGKGVDATPRTSRKRSSPSRSPSPTPRRLKTPANHDGTTFLIDFTQQMESVGSYRHSPAKANTQPDLLKYMNSQRSPNKSSNHTYSTPRKENNILHLLDFELPPAPTPRSVPTITVRELESLKSSYLSQISSLKATLSGREAEVESLKRAVGDAERRVGEAQETLREEKDRREWAEQEKASWEKRGQEVENVLKSVKEEVMKGESEKEELLRKMDDCERRAEDAEARAIRAEERFAESLAARASSGDGDPAAVEEQVQRLVAAQIDAKIEAVSRELHTVYKEKHERKVATLKKSYEARGEKKCAELQQKLGELEKQNEDLLAAKDATFSGPLHGTSPSKAQKEAEAELKAQIKEHRAHLARLENEMQTSQQQQDQLMRELEQERIEKGDLVAAVDEMLALQSEQGPSQGAMSVVEDFRKSIGRPPSSLRVPGGGIPMPGESKIGRGAASGIGRSRVTGGGVRANIERMGRLGSGASAE
ncbi:hypothetical protein M409DRAFT_67007 [Zasmidium cellare ATCC 36951]|uniref:Uncharacterized protein n=1 Tax=Zasmidium cellare ATCC 36951 TaxID=1080233 RepID=A0A6A6CEH2_ZASCE|nr:uncharacterized protein M409DRAFT_67007 [Zasmidium cellare ATCC 36951]KAF2165604.1 hypothetical protein M409DRAFT_67007 [Zasmidium cellare ATCC 36951]